ncbi:MAG: alpha/beta fold hydrolase [Actinomycetes bacterium]
MSVGADAATAPDHLPGDPDRHDVPDGGRSGFVVVDGRQVHYLEWGRADRPSVLALHGGGQTAYMYEQLGQALRDTHHVLAPDLPGHGDSDGLPGTAILGRHEIAASLPPLVAEFGLGKVALVGASLGGITAITLARSKPELVQAIVLIDVGHQLEEAGVQRIIKFMSEHESFGSLEEAASAIAEYAPRKSKARTTSLTRNLRQRSDGRWIWKHGFGRLRPGMPDPADSWRDILDGLDDDARQVSVPALVLRGAESDVLSEDGARDVAELIPDGRVVVVPDAGHLTAADNPDGTVAHIKSFLADINW